MKGPQAAFGPRLRAERERRGVSLESVSRSTKIKAALLAGLERGDVSQWPAGIFRRAYVRSYANAIGVDPAPLVTEFLQLFPESGTDSDLGVDAVASTRTPLRITFAVEQHDELRRALTRAAGAGLELSAVLLLGGLVALLSTATFWMASGLVALVYYPVATTCLGGSRSRRDLQAAWTRFTRAVKAQSQAARRKRFHLIPRLKPRTEAAHVGVEEELPQRRTAAS